MGRLIRVCGCTSGSYQRFRCVCVRKMVSSILDNKSSEAHCRAAQRDEWVCAGMRRLLEGVDSESSVSYCQILHCHAVGSLKRRVVA